MDLINVDVVGSEATQAGLNARAEPPPAGVAEQPVTIQPETALGGDDRLLAACPLPQRLAEDLLGDTEPAALRCVEEIDAEIQGVMDGVPAFLEIGGAPVTSESPSPERNDRHL
jgi:hypothetical protein